MTTLHAGRVIQEYDPTEFGIWLFEHGYSLRICNVPEGSIKLWDTVLVSCDDKRTRIDAIRDADAVTKLKYLHVRP